MPDASIVEQTFVEQIAHILTSEPYQPYANGYSDVLDKPFRLFRGWPVDNKLVDDLNSTPSITNISVFSMPGARNTTRFLRQMMNQVVDVPTPTMVAELFPIPPLVSGGFVTDTTVAVSWPPAQQTVTFSGTGSPNEVIGVAFGNTAGMAIRLTANDTPTTVAATFARGLPHASAVGGVLTIDTFLPVGVAIGCDVTMLREVHRSCGLWKVGIWASTPQLRDQFASLIDPGLQGMDRFFFRDGSCSGPIVNCGGMVDDVPEKQKLWRRDLHYDVEYPTDTVSIVPVMVLGNLNMNDLAMFTAGDFVPTYANTGSVGTGGVVGL